MPKATDDINDKGGMPKTAAEEDFGRATKPKILRVHSALPAGKDGGFPVALYEVDSSHPGQPDPSATNNPDARIGKYEAYVAGPKVVEVAETPEVSKAIRDGKIIVD